MEQWAGSLDGNAIGGLMLDVFGAEMTGAMGTCAACGMRAPLAEVVVYLRGPGTIGRCRRCGIVLMAFVTVRGLTCVDLRGFADLEPPPAR